MAENSETQIVSSETQMVRSLQATFTQSITSPLPLASEIQGYEQVLPGSADRILKMAEKESEHRRELEKRSLEIEGRDSLISMILATIVLVTIIACVVGLILGGYTEGAGLLAGSSSLFLVVNAFLKSRNKGKDHPSDND